MSSAVRADRMRGGRNKFGPMYKRDRALKQQRKALIQASGFKIESSSAITTHHRDLTFTGGLLPFPILHSTSLPTTESDHISYQPTSLCSFLPSNSLVATQYQCTSFSNGTIKSEYINCASSTGAVAGIASYKLYSRPFSPQGFILPHLVSEFLRCEPDELQLHNKITTRLLQEQKGWEKQGNPNTFSLMCLMADQTLFSIVEWARTSIFFKQLKVRSVETHNHTVTQSPHHTFIVLQ